MGPMSITRLCFFSSAWGRMITVTSCTRSARENTSSFRVMRPLSMRDMSSTSLTRLIRWVEAVLIFCRQSCTLDFSSMWDRPMEVIPTMAFMGVRMSWDILERKLLLALLAASAAFRASSSASFICSSSCLRCRRFCKVSRIHSSCPSPSITLSFSSFPAACSGSAASNFSMEYPDKVQAPWSAYKILLPSRPRSMTRYPLFSFLPFVSLFSICSPCP